ncbi:Maf family protein [Marinobacter sp.]|uniref:Maf family protein n=1 Tax=Marinobacter sp. TaxID=50741 RepID=UPI003565841C
MTKPVILASASPRRADLLRQLGLCFETRPVDIDETPQPGETPSVYVYRLAREKAVAGFELAGEPEALVLGSDTTVVLDGRILGKPADRDDARVMLRALSGRTHQVMTGVALASQGGTEVTVSTTDVAFRPLDEREIAAYCETGEPLDKAGGYGIQGRGGAFVSSITGSYSAVVGLPLDVTADLLARAGLPVWDYWTPDNNGD